MKQLLAKVHERLGDLWWYSLMIFVACRSGDVIQAFIGLWLVPKYVGPEELGAVLPLQQLTSFLTVPLAVLATVFAKYVNTYATRGEYGKVKGFIRDVFAATAVLFALCIGGAYLVIPHFYVRLNVASGMLTVLILAAGFAGNVSNLFASALQGLKMFRTITVQSLISAPIRLATLLVAMPIRALSGYILGQTTPPAACSVLAFCSLRRRLAAHPPDTAWRRDLPEILRYLWPVAVYMGLNLLFTTVTTTIYRQRLPEIESAAYYILTRFAEIAGYLGGTVVAVLVPLASEAHENGRRNPHILVHGVLSSVCSGVLLALAFALTAKPVFALTDAWRPYLDYANLLPLQTLYTGIVVGCGIVVSYEMACRRFGIAAFSLVLNFFWTIFLVSFTGADFFIGILPESTVAAMKSLQVATLANMTKLTLAFSVAQLALTTLYITWRSRTTHAPKLALRAQGRRAGEAQD